MPKLYFNVCVRCLEFKSLNVIFFSPCRKKKFQNHFCSYGFNGKWIFVNQLKKRSTYVDACAPITFSCFFFLSHGESKIDINSKTSIQNIIQQGLDGLNKRKISIHSVELRLCNGSKCSSFLFFKIFHVFVQTGA